MKFFPIIHVGFWENIIKFSSVKKSYKIEWIDKLSKEWTNSNIPFSLDISIPFNMIGKLLINIGEKKDKETFTYPPEFRFHIFKKK